MRVSLKNQPVRVKKWYMILLVEEFQSQRSDRGVLALDPATEWHYSTVQSVKTAAIRIMGGAFVLFFGPHCRAFGSSSIPASRNWPSKEKKWIWLMQYADVQLFLLRKMGKIFCLFCDPTPPQQPSYHLTLERFHYFTTDCFIDR